MYIFFVVTGKVKQKCQSSGVCLDQLSYLDPDIFSCTSRQNCSGSVRLDGWIPLVKSRANSPATDSQSYWVVGFDWVIRALVFKAISQVSWRQEQVFFEDCPVFGSIPLSPQPSQVSQSLQMKHCHTVLHCGDDLELSKKKQTKKQSALYQIQSSIWVLSNQRSFLHICLHESPNG